MKHIFLTILLFPCIVFSARVTDIKCSIINGGKTVENVTINSAWTGTDGTITLSAAVPATVNIGDVINDGTNSYLITAISGSDLTTQDAAGTGGTDPTTGAATILEAYQSIEDWEDDLDDPDLYVSGDNAIAELYNDGGAFDLGNAIFEINGGGTVGLNKITFTAADGERHDGTEDSGVEITGEGGVSGNDGFFKISTSVSMEVSWIEIDYDGRDDSGTRYCLRVNTNAGHEVKNCLISSEHNGASTVGGIQSIRDGCDFLNNVVWGMDGVAFDFSSSNAENNNFYNNTVYNDNIAFSVNNASSPSVNNIGLNTTGDDCFSGTFGTSSNNMDDDGTAPGSSNQNSVTIGDQFVSTVAGSEDFHLKSGSDAIDQGQDIGTTPSGVEVDIDGRDRDAEADTWDIGAHEFVSAGGAEFHPGRIPRVINIEDSTSMNLAKH